MAQELPSLSIDAYDYPLPDEQIARYPAPRGQSRLLLYRAGQPSGHAYGELPRLLPPESLLLLNETKVVQARLLFPRAEGRPIEVFCLEPEDQQSVETAMQSRHAITYRCLVGGAKKWKDRQWLEVNTDQWKLRAQRLERGEGYFRIRLEWEGPETFGELLEMAGKTPLPPYLQRPAEESDRQRYQTVFASRPGSVAAPTAGLHFTPELLQEVKDQGHALTHLTLHVGAGTFKPVSHDDVRAHVMHAEEVWISQAFLQRVSAQLQREAPLIPVGTTSLRALESSYHLACLWKAGRLPRLSPAEVPQWAGYDTTLPRPHPAQALSELAGAMERQGLQRLRFHTQLIIAPGYQHRLITGLITNFHQPRSTLLLLVASLVGPRWRAIYQWALEHDFRFLSYGDGQLLLPFSGSPAPQ